jgi:hypothetical protein
MKFSQPVKKKVSAVDTNLVVEEIQHCFPTITHPKVTKQNCHLPWISIDVYENIERRPLSATQHRGCII